jgi:hypothetical protein
MAFFLKALDALNDVRYKDSHDCAGAPRDQARDRGLPCEASHGGTTQGSPVNPWKEGDAAWIDRKCWARQYC